MSRRQIRADWVVLVAAVAAVIVVALWELGRAAAALWAAVRGLGVLL